MVLKVTFVLMVCFWTSNAEAPYGDSASSSDGCNDYACVGLYVCTVTCPDGKRVIADPGPDGGIRMSASECSLAGAEMLEMCQTGSITSSNIAISSYGPFETREVAESFRDNILRPLNAIFANASNANTPSAPYPRECSSRRDTVAVQVDIEEQISEASCGCGDFIKNLLLEGVGIQKDASFCENVANLLIENVPAGKAIRRAKKMVCSSKAIGGVAMKTKAGQTFCKAIFDETGEIAKDTLVPLCNVILKVAKDEFHVSLDQIVINETEGFLDKAGVTGPFNKLVETVCGRILCGDKTKSCLLQGNLLQLADGAISGYCDSQPKTVTVTTTITKKIVTTKYFAMLQFQIPYALDKVNDCVQAKIALAVAACAGLDAGQVYITVSKATTRSTNFFEHRRLFRTSDEGLRNDHEGIRASGDLSLIIINITSLRDGNHATSVTSSLTENALNNQMGLEGLASIKVVANASVFTTDSETSITSVSSKTEQTGSNSGNSGNSGCFPSKSLVTLEDNRTVRMDQLRVGDRVLTSKGFRRVMYFGHADPNAFVKFYRAHTDTGSSIHATALHTIIVRDERDVVAMSHLSKGDRIWSINNFSKQMLPSTVTDVEILMDWGLYSPYTETYDIVVDNVLASCGTWDWRGLSEFFVKTAIWSLSILPEELITGRWGIFSYLDDVVRRPHNLAASEGKTFWPISHTAEAIQAFTPRNWSVLFSADPGNGPIDRSSERKYGIDL